MAESGKSSSKVDLKRVQRRINYAKLERTRVSSAARDARTPTPVPSDAVELLALYKSRKHRRRLVGVRDACGTGRGVLDGGGV